MRNLLCRKLWQKRAICLATSAKCNFVALSNSKVNANEINSYGKMLKRISTALSSHEQATVKRTFSWLICSRRPLRTIELEHALLIQPGDNDFSAHTSALQRRAGTLWPNRGEEKGIYNIYPFLSKRVHTQIFMEYDLQR